MEVLIAGNGGTWAAELETTLTEVGHSVHRIEREQMATALAALSPELVVVDEEALTLPSVRTAIAMHRRQRSLRVVVLGDNTRGLTDVRLLPACLSITELVRQLGVSVVQHEAVTEPPPEVGPPLPSRVDSGLTPRGLFFHTGEHDASEALRPTTPNMPAVSGVAYDSSRPTTPDPLPPTTRESARPTTPDPLQTISAKPPQPFCVVDQRGAIHEIGNSVPFTLGRGLDNQVVLEDPGVSRQHARIERTPGGLVLRDPGSAHGVHLNGLPIEEQPLRHGDCVQIGRFVFHVVQGDTEAAKRWQAERRAVEQGTATLSEANARRSGSVMRGSLGIVDLPAILQMLIVQRRSGQLALSDQGRALGSFHFIAGRPIHAETSAGLQGVEAFYRLLPMQEGEFVFLVGVESPPATIDVPATALLLEGCRRLADERSKAG